MIQTELNSHYTKIIGDLSPISWGSALEILTKKLNEKIRTYM